MEQAYADAAGWHPGPVVLRKSWQRIVLPAVLGCLPSLVIPWYFEAISSGRGLPGDPWAFIPLPLAVALAAVGLFADRRRVLILSAGTMTARIGWRTREIAARDITAVTLDRVNGSRVVSVWTRDGKAHRIHVAGRGRGLFQQSFEHDWHLIGQWWLANRGGDWQAPLSTVPTFATSWERLNGFDWRPQT